ncbi:hypothetical protein FSARC_8558 [Fusarium sarcochroum]|uniref:AAA+ ATPase domain-containing protein n=1 Tax=Fusarium sarcochroum TaxID=1208366 RepID=A0A8H4X6V0_9HYPO|nr:hypothetical protein FSARC_8558 [Fusarium sarcochroum]
MEHPHYQSLYQGRPMPPNKQRPRQVPYMPTMTSNQQSDYPASSPSQGRDRRGPPPSRTRRGQVRDDYVQDFRDSESDTEQDANESSASHSAPNQPHPAVQVFDERFSPPERERDVEPDRDYEMVNRPIMRMQADWRGEICDMLGISPSLSDPEIVVAKGRAKKVLKQAEHWRAEAKALQKPPRYQIIHSVSCQRSGRKARFFLDPPQVVNYGPYSAHLKTAVPIDSFPVFMAENKEIVFLVYKDYKCCYRYPTQESKGKSAEATEIDASSLLVREHISIISPDLKSAMVRLGRAALEKISHPDFAQDQGINHPYIWWFHGRNEMRKEMSKLPPSSIVNLMGDYVFERMSEEWAIVDKLLGKNKITPQYMDYLFVGGLAISKKHGNHISKLQGVEIDDWIERRTNIPYYSANINVKSWIFDGSFRQRAETLPIQDLPSETEQFDITELPLYPVDFASPIVKEALQKRGHMFWKCRSRNYVSCVTEADDELQNSMESRFMIDFTTHKKLHRNTTAQAEKETPPGPGDLDRRFMSQDNPELGNDFFMCLPTSMYGFNMDKKEWVNLDVHYFQDVVWNTEAFKLLVIEQKTKDLIQAVVSNQLRTTENADLIRGKGNGLFILLHGGPGTGKTLTAESVAEVAKKPLYRVTCGDIGTRAEAVEEYLHVVLHLGKIWGCVVLLDEADVFLEQRSMVNLERNALVSVFLRVLEYYDGILILTSNRVGIFDEAFKSRIQLNLRYKNLDWNQRWNIWNNFIIRLKRLDDEAKGAGEEEQLSYGIKVKEITAKLDKLASANLNGRQIRNAISTARQLARYHQVEMGYEHLEAVIQEAEKFDEYLLELNKTCSADEIQRDRGQR